ncbi:MAG: FlhC family transcriptional regulator, partial [Steroidobacteraceae bacterium]|nr:FlhC family transcriptional regulator [Steroidobacteraceae bacterium]
MRDTARLELAVRLIRLEARTRTIREWTGLTDDRIRKLYRSYLRDGSQPIKRHRGKSPQLASYFLRTHRALRHASALAALLSAFGALPPGGARPRGTSRLPLAGA